MPRLIAPPAEVVRGLYAASLLARGDPSGAAALPADPGFAWRSFFAAILCLPAFLALRFLASGQADAPDTARTLIAEVAGYACAWAGFALLSWPVARWLQREAQWPRFLAAWNWSNVIQYAALLLAISMPLPAALSAVLGFAAFLYAVWLEWFTTRHALGVDPWPAAGIVLLDLLMGLAFGSVTASLVG